MIFHLADDNLNIEQSIHWGCFGGLRRTDSFVFSDFVGEVREINEHNGFDTEYSPADYDNDIDEAANYELDVSYVLLDDDFEYDAFNPVLADYMEWYINRSPWNTAIASTFEEWKDGKFYVHAIGVPCDLAVQALCQFRDAGRNPEEWSGYWSAMKDADVPDTHKFFCCSRLRCSDSYLSWDTDDGALLRIGIGKDEYLSFLNGARRGVGASDDMDLVSVGGYTMSLAGQWGGDYVTYHDDDRNGIIYTVFSNYYLKARSQIVEGLFQTYSLNMVVDYKEFAETTFKQIGELNE